MTGQTSAERGVDAHGFNCAEGIEGESERLALAGAGVIAKQETQRDGPRKFRRSANATIRCVVSRRNLFVGLVQNNGLQITRGRRLCADNLNELLSGPPGRLRDGIVLLSPRVSDLLLKRFELFRRTVRAAEQRVAVGSEHYVERPAGASRCGFDLRDI